MREFAETTGSASEEVTDIADTASGNQTESDTVVEEAVEGLIVSEEKGARALSNLWLPSRAASLALCGARKLIASWLSGFCSHQYVIACRHILFGTRSPSGCIVIGLQISFGCE